MSPRSNAKDVLPVPNEDAGLHSGLQLVDTVDRNVKFCAIFGTDTCMASFRDMGSIHEIVTRSLRANHP